MVIEHFNLFYLIQIVMEIRSFLLIHNIKNLREVQSTMEHSGNSSRRV